VQALRPTAERIAREGDTLAQNLFLLAGSAMSGTVVTAPTALPALDAPAPAPTTPDADIAQWLAALDRLAQLPIRVLVPGHGPVVRGPEAIAQTRDYLQWVQATLRDAAERGLDMNEVMRLQAPERLRRLEVLQAEWQRTVMHLYPAVEEGSLRR
jgi:glyoxylase-like metal-dependent hydrolase (beta-lactamase superfamily II)